MPVVWCGVVMCCRAPATAVNLRGPWTSDFLYKSSPVVILKRNAECTEVGTLLAGVHHEDLKELSVIEVFSHLLYFFPVFFLVKKLCI